MTEAEWLRATDPMLMLECIRNRVSARKLRLFSVACCREAWMRMPSEDWRITLAAVEVQEALADGQCSTADLLRFEQCWIANPDAWQIAETTIWSWMETPPEYNWNSDALFLCRMFQH